MLLSLESEAGLIGALSALQENRLCIIPYLLAVQNNYLFHYSQRSIHDRFLATL